ncbi:uncharacterized protein LOC110460318 [Mizuhopecten yessoensis]|uniref:CREB/ATF bZIP transcription factor n=1 Tax=Mizuhopecten yessoensis TaxID=6573 RepID=A0A210Q2P4_MIZYE|nr:uncharacterized protein LOC110460318 [Mizuhopecten yessoensis]OWF43023.1 CREB/ATF bZIP transcription factor [Mizuhopecten yessoensis]
MINVDFNFGSVPSSEDSPDEELEALKNSPSHQSDSGMSMGSESLASRCSDNDIVYSPGFEIFDDAQLMGYLSSSSRTPSPETTTAVERVSDRDTNNDNAPATNATSNDKGSSIQNHVRILRDRNVTVMTTPKTKPVTIENKSKLQVKTILPTPAPKIKVIKVLSSNQHIDSDGEVVEALTNLNKKNAIQAKINREKKKVFIKSLEDTVDELRAENDALKVNQTRMEECQRVLEDEVQYLKSVLANQSALSSLLQNIPNVQNVTLSTSFNRRKRSAVVDHDYIEHQDTDRCTKRNCSTAGICLHVDKGHASLEFCSHCSKNAKLADDS